MSQKTKWRKKLALSAVSMAIMLVVGEVAVRLANIPDRLLEKLPAAEPTLPWIQYHDTVGWVNKPGICRHTRKGEFDVGVEVNANGFRGPECAIEKKPGVFRVLIVGDSFTFGHGAEGKDVYAAQLQDLAPNVEVLNAGIVGTGHDQQLVWLQKEGLKFKPDLLVWGFSSADIPRNVVYFRRVADLHTGLNFGKPRYVLEGRKLVLKNVPTPAPGDVDSTIEKYLTEERARRGSVEMFLRHSRLFAAVVDAIAELRGRKEQLDLAAALAHEFVRTASDAGSELVIVHLPVQKWLLSKGPINAAKKRATESLLAQLVKDTGVPLLDLWPAFQARTPDDIKKLFIKDGHYSREGHRLVAEGILDYLRQKGFVKGMNAPIARP
ncbi:MAG: SGNH/GDSL hydrolase family protein [bacterium]